MAKVQSECNMDDPAEFAVWALAAGVPDPRTAAGMPNLPLIPPMCFAEYSKLLWDFGFRHHEDKQTKWVGESAGPGGGLAVRPVVDVKPDEVRNLAAQMLAEQFPDAAARLSEVTAETRDAEVAAAASRLTDSLARLEAAKARLEGMAGG